MTGPRRRGVVPPPTPRSSAHCRVLPGGGRLQQQPEGSAEDSRRRRSPGRARQVSRDSATPSSGGPETLACGSDGRNCEGRANIGRRRQPRHDRQSDPDSRPPGPLRMGPPPHARAGSSKERHGRDDRGLHLARRAGICQVPVLRVRCRGAQH